MTKDAFWFKHDSNARNDRKLVKVRRKLGLEGIGLYWCIVEMLREESGYKIELSEVEDIAFELGISEDLANRLIFDFDLFENDENYFWSESLIRRMEKHDELKEKRRAAGRKGGKAKAANKQKPSNAKAMLKQTSSIRGDKIREENIREEKREDKTVPVPKMERNESPEKIRAQNFQTETEIKTLYRAHFEKFSRYSKFDKVFPRWFLSRVGKDSEWVNARAMAADFEGYWKTWEDNDHKDQTKNAPPKSMNPSDSFF